MITRDKNLYPGVNAHLNSYLQAPKSAESWETFHADYITFLRTMLDRILPPGYYAASEKSLQIGEYEAQQIDPLRKSRTIADILVQRQFEPARTVSTGSGSDLAVVPPAYILPMPETIDDDDKLTSITIFLNKTGSPKGHPVTRIEVLSPSNKPGQSHYEQYAIKRVEVLKAGLRLVEVDFLDMYPPIRTALPNYLAHDQGASPYVILVTDPRPTFEQGFTQVYPFGVLSPIPVIAVPLEGKDLVPIDFGAAYNELLESSRLFRLIADYESDPVQFERFTLSDQQALRVFLVDVRNP